MLLNAPRRIKDASAMKHMTREDTFVQGLLTSSRTSALRTAVAQFIKEES
jgi:hypothetical protein